MITNLLVVVFIVLAVAWFSTQGLFSALLHLIVLICGAALALAAWEPLTLGFLIDKMPEYAWGVGLLAPLVLIVLGLRIAVDMLVPGNVQFYSLVNNIGGGAVGFVTAMLTAGLIIIGVQFIGPFSLGGYEPWTMENGKLVRTGHLWLGADDFADSVLTTLSGGVFYPFSGDTLAKVQPSLTEAAGAYRQAAREYARMSMRPKNVKLTQQFAPDAKQLPPEIQPAANTSLLVVGTNINIAGSGKSDPGAGDLDGAFTAGPSQVGLLVSGPKDATQIVPAVGYVVSKSFGSLTTPGEFARTKPVGEADIDWLFNVPEGFKPVSLRIKQLRLPIADAAAASDTQVAQWLSETEWKPVPVAANPDNTTTTSNTTMEAGHGTGAGVEGVDIRVSDELPVTLSDNWLSSRANNVETRDNRLVSAEGSLHIDEGRVDRNLAINHIEHPENQALVRVQMTDAKARSMLGEIMQQAGQLLAPVLVSDSGDKYFAIGYVRYAPSSENIYLNIDTYNTIRAMKQIDINRLADGEQLYLYFRVARNVHLTKFEIGGSLTQKIDVPVP